MAHDMAAWDEAARAQEIDAAERYTEFADQMEVPNNPEVAQLFRKLAHIEGLHAKQILAEMGWTEMPKSVYAMQWTDNEPPETAPHDAPHYRMIRTRRRTRTDGGGNRDRRRDRCRVRLS